MNILYAEDEQQLSMAVTEILKMEGYTVTAVFDGEQAAEKLSEKSFDAVILDIMMPKMNGIEVLKKMRAENDFTPVLMLTAKADIDDRIEGLGSGADDYLGKPFAMKELIARINSMIRRSVKYKDSVLTIGNTSLDCTANELASENGSLRLSKAESEILAYFIKHKEMVISSDDISEHLDNNESGEEYIKLYVSYLVNKLGSVHSDHTITSEAGGYCLRKRESD